MRLLLPGITFFMLVIGSALASMPYLVLDIDKVVNQSKAYNGFKARWDSVNQKYQQEIEVYEKKIDLLDKSLLAAIHKIDESELKKSRNLIGKYENRIRQLMQQRTVVLDRAMVDALNILRKHIFSIVQEYATLHKVNLILSTSQVIYYTSNLDITQKILHELNAKLDKINIEINSNVHGE
jgi:Skp family chaperone for outer membrane proteins